MILIFQITLLINLKEACLKTKLTDLFRALPNGVSTNIGESGIRLSVDKDKVALAKINFHDEISLVFDEATSALNLDTEAEVVNEIKKMKGPKNNDNYCT